MKEVHLHITLRQVGAPGDLSEHLKTAGANAVMVRLPDDAIPALTRADGPDLALPDMIATLPNDIPLAATLDTLRARIDKRHSRLAVVERHTVLEGRDTIRLFYGLRRLSHLTLAEFHDYWLNTHADYGRRMIPPYSYHQLHCQPDAADTLANETGLSASDLDGIVEVDFPSVEALIAQLTRPDVAHDAFEDEQRFIDHARSMIWAYTVC